jgi:hypothetical protein
LAPVPKSDSARPRLQTDITEALAAQETPRVKWKVVGQIAAAFAVLWVTSFIGVPFVGYWGVGVVGVLTLLAMGFGIYVWRMTSKSAAILDIMKGATDEAGRQRALDALAQGGNSDAMKVLARAQLLAQTDPNAAQELLQSLDLEKVPAVVQDDVRGQLAMLYLRNNRVNEARALTDGIRLDRRPDPRSKGLYAAVMAEALARSGATEEARKLLETYPPAEAAGDEVRVMLLRAQVFTFMAQKKRGLAKQALDAMAQIEPGLLGGFVYKGASPELVKLAKQSLTENMGGPKVKWKRS